MTDLLHRLVSAIATAEGFYANDPNARPRRNHNPGNLTASPLTRLKDGVGGKGFVVFKSDAEGIAALYHQIAKHILRGESLRSMITLWAPPHENDTENYIRETARRTGITALDEPLLNLLTIERIP